jgi:DNA-binding PadR family transcriptional regulator
MQSSVRWALLGLVIQRPSYGYELAGRFERSYGDTLRLHGHAQIYEGLTGLERYGFVEAFQTTGGRQPKIHYRATKAGLDAYQERLANYARDEHLRLRLFAHELAVFAHRRPDGALESLASCEQVWLEESARTPASHSPEGPLDPVSDLAALLEAKASQLSREAKLAWVDLARRACKRLAQSTTASQ